MQNNSSELIGLIEDLNTFFEKKKERIDDSKQGECAKFEARIRALKVYQVELEGLYSTNENMLLNFRKRVADIKLDISQL